MKTMMYKREFKLHSKDFIVINGKVEIYWINKRWELHIQLEDHELNPEYTELQKEFIGYCNGFKWSKFVTDDIKDEVMEKLDNYIDDIDNEYDDDHDYTWDEYDNFVLNDDFPDDMFELDDKIVALAKHLNVGPQKAIDYIEASSYDDCIFNYGKREYLVCDDDEADERWDESIDNYIEECVLYQIPKDYQRYFDEEAFKSDCKYDGRGHSLSGYDGNEYEEGINGTTYYIYRLN